MPLAARIYLGMDRIRCEEFAQEEYAERPGQREEHMKPVWEIPFQDLGVSVDVIKP